MDSGHLISATAKCHRTSTKICSQLIVNEMVNPYPLKDTVVEKIFMAFDRDGVSFEVENALKMVEDELKNGGSRNLTAWDIFGGWKKCMEIFDVDGYLI